MICKQELDFVERAMGVIEAKDDDFLHNPRWIKLREVQDLWYEASANEQIEKLSKKYEETGQSIYLRKIEFIKESLKEKPNDVQMS